MDFTSIAIGFLLVWCGAFFFGYPIGKIVGRRQIKNEINDVNQDGKLPKCVAAAKRRLSSDILDSEILEVKKNG